ncbi:hypothetical protein Acr_00g0054070 [Actinidia rufa]|uniref:Uncharacterized protein n=1 Tax=Actinidia rufa TaxID=165716 RepID=A0A7J0DLQ7_9ERIC|nr:hypothetical protein Acr_00g0054070 [Actinidia rufa]
MRERNRNWARNWNHMGWGNFFEGWAGRRGCGLAGLRLAGLGCVAAGQTAQAERGRIAGAVLHTTQALAWLHGAEAGLRGCWAAWSGAGAAGGGAAWLLDRLGCVVAVWTTHGTGLHRAVLGCTVQGQRCWWWL